MLSLHRLLRRQKRQYGTYVIRHRGGDQASFLSANDWYSRYGVTDKPWEVWKGGFLPGQTKANANGKGTYLEDAKINLTVKVRIDGYNISMWIKGTNHYVQAQSGEWKDFSSENWVTCYENVNIYDRYNTDNITNDGRKGTESLKELYTLDGECYFGISHRNDTAAEDGAYKFTGMSYTVIDR